MQQTPPPAEVDALIALYNARRYAELEGRARILVEQFPNFGFGWKLLGGALQMQGKSALLAFRKASELMPGEADAHYNLAVAQKSLGLLDDAAASYRRALKIKPDYAEAHSNLGNVLKDLGRLDESVTCYRRALALKPDSADAHNNLGAVLKDLGQLDEAVACYRRAIKIKPDYADAHYNLGNALKDLGQLDEAAASYRRALEVKPDFADAYNNLGTALKDLGQPEAALASYRRLLELKPDFAEAHNNLGVALKDLGQLDAALASYRRAVELKPDYAEAHNNMGNVLKDLGRHEDALASYRKALEFKPDLAEARSNLLFSLNYTANHNSSYCLTEAREYGRMVDEKVKLPFSSWQCLAKPERLRVGLISGDLCNHPVSYALKSLLEQIDFTRIELIAYSTVHTCRRVHCSDQALLRHVEAIVWPERRSCCAVDPLRWCSCAAGSFRAYRSQPPAGVRLETCPDTGKLAGIFCHHRNGGNELPADIRGGRTLGSQGSIHRNRVVSS